MFVMFIQRIHRAWLEQADFSGFQIFDFPFARDAVVGFKMVLIVTMNLMPLRDDGVMHGIADIILLHDKSRAAPVFSNDMKIGAFYFPQGTNYHNKTLIYFPDD